MDPNYIYNGTKLISDVQNDCSCECFDKRTCNATWSLGGELSSGHALPTAAVHIVRLSMKLSGRLNTSKKKKV